MAPKLSDSTDEEALVIFLNVLQRIADTALAGFKEDGICEAEALSQINNLARETIDAAAKRMIRASSGKGD